MRIGCCAGQLDEHRFGGANHFERRRVRARGETQQKLFRRISRRLKCRRKLNLQLNERAWIFPPLRLWLLDFSSFDWVRLWTAASGAFAVQPVEQTADERVSATIVKVG